MRITKISTLSSILLGRATSFTPKFTPVTPIPRKFITSTSASKQLASLERDDVTAKGSAVSFKVTYVSKKNK